MLSPDFRKRMDATSKHVPHHWFVSFLFMPANTTVVVSLWNHATQNVPGLVSFEKSFVYGQLRHEDTRFLNFINASKFQGFFSSHFKKLLQNVIFAIPQKRKIIHAYNNVSSINNVYLILHVAFLTYMTDREIFFEWLVKVKVLHRLAKKERKISTLNSFLKSLWSLSLVCFDCSDNTAPFHSRQFQTFLSNSRQRNWGSHRAEGLNRSS